MLNKRMLTAGILCSFFIFLIFSGCGKSPHTGLSNARSTESSLILSESETIKDPASAAESREEVGETDCTETAPVATDSASSCLWAEGGYQYLRHQLKTGTWMETTLKGTVYHYVNLFYNSLQIETISVQEDNLDEILLSYGIKPDAKAEHLEDERICMCAFSGYCCTLDLYAVEPIIATADHKILCKLKSDEATKLLFVLDLPDGTPQTSPTSEPCLLTDDSCSEIVPKEVYYYPGPAWNPESENISFLINGNTTNSEESEICRKLFLAHSAENSYDISAVLDGKRSYDIVTVCFENFPGLEYHFYVYNYHFDEKPGLEVYCRPRSTSVFVPIEKIESIGGQFSD